MKKFLSVLVAVSFIFTMVAVNTSFASAATTINAVGITDKVTYISGDFVQYELKLSDIPEGMMVNSSEFKVYYDSNVLELATGGEDSDIQSTYMDFCSKINYVSPDNIGNVSVLFCSFNDIALQADQPILKINFRVKNGTNPGTTTITTASAKLFDSNGNGCILNNGNDYTNHINIVNMNISGMSNVSSQTAQAGDLVTYDVILNDVPEGQKLNNADLSIGYDKDVLELATGNKDDDAQSTYLNFNSKTLNNYGALQMIDVKFNSVNDVPILNNESILRINFRVKENAPEGSEYIVAHFSDMRSAVRTYSVNDGTDICGDVVNIFKPANQAFKIENVDFTKLDYYEASIHYLIDDCVPGGSHNCVVMLGTDPQNLNREVDNFTLSGSQERDVKFSTLEPGTTYYYTIEISVYPDVTSKKRNLGIFTFRTPDAPLPKTDDCGNTKDSANIINIADKVKGSFDYLQDIDYYKFTVQENGIYNIDFCSQENMGFFVQTSNMTRGGLVNGLTSNGTKISKTVQLTAGTPYYVKVYYSAYPVVGDYEFCISKQM